MKLQQMTSFYREELDPRPEMEIAASLIRGTSSNQPKGLEHVLVSSGVGVPTGALILGQD